MYCISLAIVVSWIHILIKHSQFLLTRSRMRRLWTREMENHCLLNSLVLETPSAKCERRSPRFYLLVLSRYKKLKLNGKHVSLIWKRSADRDVKQHFFFFFFCMCLYLHTSFKLGHWYNEITDLFYCLGIYWDPCTLPRLHLILGKCWHSLIRLVHLKHFSSDKK